MDELVILDFETTGLSPDYSRVIEVGAVIISGINSVFFVNALNKL